jgi:hypothetical protein
MTYLVRIGRIDQNISGVGSRGYAVHRKDRKVTVIFGKIEAIGRGRTRFYWCGEPTIKPHPMCKTAQLAKSLARALVQQQLLANAKGSYMRLPKGARILSNSRRPSREKT